MILTVKPQNELNKCNAKECSAGEVVNGWDAITSIKISVTQDKYFDCLPKLILARFQHLIIGALTG